MSNIDFNSISYSVISGIAAFIATFSILKYQVRELRSKVQNHKKETAIRFKDIEDKHDDLKDKLTERIHDIDKNVSRILTILTNKAE
jgi:hypothetical protein